MTRRLISRVAKTYQRRPVRAKKLRRNRWLIFGELTELTRFITQRAPPRQIYVYKAESLYSTPSHTHTHRLFVLLLHIVVVCMFVCVCVGVCCWKHFRKSFKFKGRHQHHKSNNKHQTSWQCYNWVILAVSLLRRVFTTDKVNLWVGREWVWVCMCALKGI